MSSTCPLTQTEKEELLALKNRFNHLMNDIVDADDFDLTLIYPQTNHLDTLYHQLTDLKRCLDSFRPFNKTQLKNLQAAFDTQYTYESNRIEGNTLTLMETDLVIHQGITIDGKPLKDHIEAINHQDAIDYIREVVQQNVVFNEQTLANIHALILQGIDRSNAGVYRRDRVRIIGSRHICPNPVKIPKLMIEYFRLKETLHPVELAANMHEKLVTIHPFVDGNGRTARLIMNVILLQNGYPITIIASDKSKRADYYKTLEAAQISAPRDNRAFQLLVAEYVKEWLFNYLNMVAPSIGEDAKEKGYYFFKKLEPYLTKFAPGAE